MKLPLSFQSHFHTKPSAADPHLCCIVAYDEHNGEIQLFNYPSVLGHKGKFHYSGSESHFEVLEAKILSVRQREGKTVTRIEIGHLQNAASALSARLGLSNWTPSPDAVRACISEVPLSFSLTELVDYDATCVTA